MLAVDPSSPFSGGALLGDRVRMQDHALDPDVYIRSMASRGHLGGLAWSTPQALRVLDAAGCDVVLVETVGVGQSEVEVAGLADTTVVLLAPGMGDAIQAAKAGILEVGDVYVVNKADRDGADPTVRELRHMLTLGERRGAGRLAAADRQDGRLARARASTSWSRRSTSTAAGSRRPGALHERRLHRAADEIETHRADRAAGADGRPAQPGRRRPRRRSRPTSSPAAPTPTPRADRLLAGLTGG